MTSTIAEVRLHRVAVPLVRPFVTAVRTATEIDAMIVEVIDSDGRSGWGEAPTSWRVTGESPQSVTAAVEGPLREAALGLPVNDPAGASLALERAVVRNSSARMAVDCALYDLAAQYAGVPLFRMLARSSSTPARPEPASGSSPRDTSPRAVSPATLRADSAAASATAVRTDMTLSAVADATGIQQLVETAVQHRDAGFRTLKLKVGAGGDDVVAMQAVRDAVGPSVTLRADANQGWSPTRAVGVIRAWEDAGLDVQLIEQPVHRDDIDGLAFVTARVTTPVLADESVWTSRDAREVIARHAADMINIKLAKTGGIREAIALRDLAASAGVRVIVGCMMESHVGIAAAAAVAASIDASAPVAAVGVAPGADPSGASPGTDPFDTSSGTAAASAASPSASPKLAAAPMAHDLDAGLWMRRSPVHGGIRYEGETVHLAEAPGLGITALR
ncbi:mandelate racemase/muconate lactonizing enzyme family protein [Humibacter albus]|uniref:mandelate racemase/muconate lactonizing enzyme family protein n=1 Tax=Humibacter albus TaxID=427754 RepID=UPI00047DED21|nr:dipeptide epimerase [Humibacter albus]